MTEEFIINKDKLLIDKKEKPILVQIGRAFFELRLSFELGDDFIGELTKTLANRTVRLLKEKEY